MSPLAISVIFGIILCVSLAFVGVRVLEYFSTDRRTIRSDRKQGNKMLANALRREQLATATLTRIAADDVGNPALEAQIALADINRNKLQELES